MPRTLRWLVPAATTLGLSLAGVSVWARTAPRPELGPVDGDLRPCPDRPSCVCTCAEDPIHAMDPVPIESAERTRARLEAIVTDMPRSTIVVAEPRYLAVEFRTLLGFVDDVELLIDEQAGLLRFRSASRRGHSDLGVNRRRMETIIARLRSSGG